jgi:hypothetical protein
MGAVALALACVLWLPSAALAAPVNDNFADREDLGAGLPVEVVRSNVGATAEATDPKARSFSPGPSFVPAGHSIWLEWEALATQYVTVSLCNSGVPLVLGVYHEPSGPGQLSEIRATSVWTGGGACTPLEGGVTFLASAGMRYEFFVDGNANSPIPSTTEGQVSMRIEATPRPPNDDFANADVLTGKWEYPYAGQFVYHIHRDGYTWAATAEPGEPKHGADASGASVWYQWTAPETGKVELNLGDQRATRFAVYRGESLGSLEQIFSDHEYGVLPVVGGTSYRIAVDAGMDEFGPEMTIFGLRLSMYKTVPLTDPAESVDRRPPRTTIANRRVRGRSATFRFRSSEAKSSFRCKLDRRRARPCESPRTYAGLATGRHVFRVYALDAAGNADPTPARARFAIQDPKAPGRCCSSDQ